MGSDKDPYNLLRFVKAQEPVYRAVLSELNAGRKRTHWMWFVFPQIDGLGHSPTATCYAIKGIDEAKAYLQHPVLGQRLRECTETLMRLNGLSASTIFGHPDDLKLCSSMTLFDHVSADDDLFRKAIDRYCGGRKDDKTLAILNTQDTE